MPIIDLRSYIVDSSGLWTDPTSAYDNAIFPFSEEDTMAPERLMLRWPSDSVVLAGPLRVRVTVQSENMMLPLSAYKGPVPQSVPVVAKPSAPPGASKTTTKEGRGPQSVPTVANPSAPSGASKTTPMTSAGQLKQGLSSKAVGVDSQSPKSLQASTIYSYTLDIPAGQAWPFILNVMDIAPVGPMLPYVRPEQLGNNLGYRILIEPAVATLDTTPISAGGELPCDFAVADRPDTARFFPAACEPCAPGASIGLPFLGAVALVTPPAAGGCVRTRFFNGMFITREDLETEQRYHRLKSKLHNRAAGAGVVWGLNVGRQGEAVVVLPGYAVDCCGNDLALTTTYKVDIAALLADPAAAPLLRLGGPQRMHLLLEYIECPSDPRPVHGDPCTPEVSRCEMSRIRETLRLRLVPPRDYDMRTESAPIQGFLDEIREIRESQGPVSFVPDAAPFRLRVIMDAKTEDQEPLVLDIRPFLGSSGNSPEELKGILINALSIQVELDPLWLFLGGTITATASMEGKYIDIANPSSQELSFTDDCKGPEETVYDISQLPESEGNTALTFDITKWRAQSLFAAEDDPLLAGERVTLTIKLTQGRHFDGYVLVVDGIREEYPPLGDPPCAGDRCDVRGRGEQKQELPRTKWLPGQDRFAKALGLYQPASETADLKAVLPWLHPDLDHPKSVADPKVLVLAWLGAWLSQMLVREHAGTKAEVWTTRRRLASQIYSAAWLLFFGLTGEAKGAQTGEAPRRLLEAWCDGGLWRGPQCAGEPHGVVIGCARVEGGTIANIDPFGGRRHVIHYPLLSHWGAQFGLAPLDITASRLFSVLCCVSALPAVDAQPSALPALVAIGSGLLALGTPADIKEKLAERNIVIVGERSVGIIELVVALSGIGTRSDTADVYTVGKIGSDSEKHKFTALVLGDLVADRTVMFLRRENG